MKFEGFQNLYQHIKQDDPKLFGVLDRIHNYLQQMSLLINDIPVDNNIQSAEATLALVLTGVSTAIPGCFIRLSGSGTYLIIGIFDMILAGAGDAGFTIIGELSVGGVFPPGQALMEAPAVQSRSLLTQMWTVTVGSKNQLVTLMGFKSGGAGGSTIGSLNTRIIAVKIS